MKGLFEPVLLFFYFGYFVGVIADVPKEDDTPANFARYLKEVEKQNIKVAVGRAGGRGNARLDSDCDRVINLPSSVRSSMKLNNFYRRYTHAYGIPIISSARVSDAALKRACYVVRFLFADRKDIRDKFHDYYGRAGVIGKNEQTTHIPEHSFLPKWWDTRARGLGATPQIPISTGGEENLLCLPTDRYRNQDIFMHEFAHGVHLVGAELAIWGFKTKLDRAFRSALGRGLWSRTYAATDYREYFAQGVNSYFNTQAFSSPPNGIHNHVNTRAKLRTYDPTLYRILENIFPCKNTVLDRCSKGSAPTLRMHCDGKGPQTQAPPPTQPPRPPTFGPRPPTFGPRPPTFGPRPPTFGPRPPTLGPRPPTLGPKPPTGCSNVWSLEWCTWRDNWACSYDCARQFCRKTCGLCAGPATQPPRPPTQAPRPPTQPPRPPTQPPQPPTKACIDNNNSCSYWARIGECQRNPGWMLDNCKKSCNKC